MRNFEDDSGRARMLGVSNFKLEQLQCLWQEARVCPRFVQNHCYAVLGWDRRVREFCQANGMVYQGFWLLTANRHTLAATDLAQVAAQYGRTIPQIIFRFASEVGMIPLTGTTSTEHMQADLEVFNFRLNPTEVARIKGLAEG